MPYPPEKQVLYCEKDKEYITIEDAVLGYEYAKGQFAILRMKNISKKFLVKTTHTVEIDGFD